MEIRQAKYTDRQEILQFIKENWQENHIFVRWPELFDDYHKNGDQINYIIAINETDNKIYGICGFIYANHDASPDVWLALWKVIPSGIPSLGMDMVHYLKEKLNCNVLACCGIRKEVMRLYQFLGYQTGTMHHFYRLNENTEYRIASVVDDKMLEYMESNDVTLVPIHSEAEFGSLVTYESDIYTKAIPFKDRDYIIRKYFHNIAYKYQVFGIRGETGAVNAVLFTKIVEANGSKALRIVDFLGDESELGKCGNELNRIMNDNDCEYVDIYEYGLSEYVLQGLGMKELDENDNNIIPNYFEPFEQQNVEIHFFTNKIDNFRMFKADGDQERPNIIYGDRK